MPEENLSRGSQVQGPFCCQAAKFAHQSCLQSLLFFLHLPGLQRLLLHVWGLIGDGFTLRFQVECV